MDASCGMVGGGEIQSDPAVQMYVCRLLCRIIGRTSGSSSEEAEVPNGCCSTDRALSEMASPVILPAAVVVGASSPEDLVGQSDLDSMLCNDGEANITDADGTSHTKRFRERIVGAVEGGLAYMGNKWDAVDNAAENLTQKAGTKATSVKDKAVETAVKGRASAEEKAMKHSKQLEGMISSKVSFIENKIRSNPTYSALESSSAKYSKQASDQLEGVADKTKAAASFMRTKSGVIASTARTKSGELASNTKDKLQAAGQNGLRVMAKTFTFNRGGA